MCTLPHRKIIAIAAVAIIFLSTMTPGQTLPAVTCQEYPMPPQQVFQGIATRSDISQSSSLHQPIHVFLRERVHNESGL